MNVPLGHDMPCLVCGHGEHHYFDCDCGCSHPPIPGISLHAD